MTARGWFASGTIALLLLGCAADDEVELFERDGDLAPRTPVMRIAAPLASAYCTIEVDGVGAVDTEEEYLPGVIHCENGGANLEALKAQAIAARSVAYYAMATEGSICNSQSCQVYTCASPPTALAHQAVQETSGLYLSYNATLTYAFFVAGDSAVSAPSCVGSSGATEHWVTYNEGLSSTDVVQTELGFVHQPGDNGYGQNRGCMGQWAARCLENDNGYDYRAIMRFFYGDDIEIVQAPGACVLPLPGESTSDDGGASEDTGADAEGTGADTTGAPSTGTTMLPSTTDPSDGEDVSQSAGELESDAEGGLESEDDGTAGDDHDGNALPDTFGETGSTAGCACDLGERERGGWLAALALVALRRRRRAR